MKPNSFVPRKSLQPRSNLSSRSLSFVGVSRSYQKYDFDDFEATDLNKSIKDVLVRYVSNIHSMYADTVNLLLTGANGTGKTMLMSILTKYAYANRYRVFLGTVAEIMNLTFTPEHRLSEDELERKQLLDNAEFVMIDELGKENFTSSGSNIILIENILRTAETKHKVICISSNLGLEDIKENYGTSIYSLLDGNFVKLEFTDSDYRKKKMLEKKAIKVLKG